MLKFATSLSFITFVIAFWNRNDLAGDIHLLPQLQQEPVQQKASTAPFQVTANEKVYTITPQFEYELYGLVVSYQHHDGNYGLHRLWGDHLNIADICVVWQDTAFSPHLSAMDFWNGQFTCNFQTSSDIAWANFKPNQISNNHLVSVDEYIRKKITKVAIGDQIKITGWLSSYSDENGGKRGTSTTRDDTGNGACETIYVHDFEILANYSNAWRKLMYIALAVFTLSLIIYLRQPFQVKSG